MNKHTRELAPLNGEDTISIQNQHGNTPLKWDQTGTISEVGDIDKYTIKIDGSGRLTNRNRRFLQPVRPNKEAVSRPAPADGLPAAGGTGQLPLAATCPSVGAKFCRTAEGGAEPSLEPPPSLNGTNSPPACNHGQV